jgi:chromosome segregation ATPase
MVFIFGLNTTNAEIYKYRDAQGVIRYTYDLAEVPEDQRPRVQTYEETAAATNSPSTQEADIAPAESPKEDGEEDTGVVDEKKIEELSKRKKELDAEFAGLMEEKYKLLKEKNRLDTLAGRDTAAVAEYDKKVKELNRKIADYQKRQEAFQKEAKEVEESLGNQSEGSES